MMPGFVRLSRISYNEDSEICYEPVYINTHYISSFRKHRSGEGTIVWVADYGRYEVKETPEEILELTTYGGKCLNDEIRGFTADNAEVGVVSVVSTEDVKKIF